MVGGARRSVLELILGTYDVIVELRYLENHSGGNEECNFEASSHRKSIETIYGLELA